MATKWPYVGISLMVWNLLTACQNPVLPTAPNPGTVTPSTAGSATPGATSPSGAPTTLPSAGETPSLPWSKPLTYREIASPTPTATPTPSAIATPISLPSSTSDISTVEKTTFNGKVFDNTNAPLDGVKVVARSLNASVTFTAETTSTGGAYAFNNAPSGVQVEITIYKSGFAPRRRVEVLKSNKQGDPNANKYDFGSDGSTSGSGSNYDRGSALIAPPMLSQPILTVQGPSPPPNMVAQTAALKEFIPQQNAFFYLSYDDSASAGAVNQAKVLIRQGEPPPKKLSRPWEFLNAETFTPTHPVNLGKFKVSMGLWSHPAIGETGQNIYELGCQVSGPELTTATRSPAVITLVVDTSASMNMAGEFAEGASPPPSARQLVQQGLTEMVGSLRHGDRINLVTFADQVTKPLSGYNYDPAGNAPFLQAVQNLVSGGDSTLAAGLNTAYSEATYHFDASKINRVFLLTDGLMAETDFNKTALLNQITSQQQAGIGLTVLGMGQRMNDHLLNELAEAGKGGYRAILSRTDAQRAFSSQFIGLLQLAARNVRFRLDYPSSLTHRQSAAEEQSTQISQVKPTHFATNSHQYFWEEFAAPTSTDVSSQTIKLTISYQDPAGSQTITEVHEQPISTLLNQEQSNIKDAHLIHALTRLIAGNANKVLLKQELSTYLSTHQTTLGNEYQALMAPWLAGTL